MIVDFRSIVLSKSGEPAQPEYARQPRRPPGALLMAVIVAVAWGLCAVWMFWE